MASDASRGPELPPTFVPVRVDDGIRASARRTPDKVALAEGPRELTYVELVERIDRVRGGAVSGLGLLADEHAAIFAPNCLEFIEIVCGLAGAGVAPALVNSRSTTEELQFICDDSAARVLFVHPSLEETARAATFDSVRKVIVLGDQYDEWLQSRRSGNRALPNPGVGSVLDPVHGPHDRLAEGRPPSAPLAPRSPSSRWRPSSAATGSTIARWPSPRSTTGPDSASRLRRCSSVVSARSTPGLIPRPFFTTLKDKRLTNVFMVPNHFRAIF